MSTIIILFDVLATAGVLLYIYRHPSADSAFGGGAFLALGGLATALLFPIYLDSPNREGLNFITNAGLLIASVGANLIAGSALSKLGNVPHKESSEKGPARSYNAIQIVQGECGPTALLAGTQVPLKALFDHIADGKPLAQFLMDFPSVSRELATTALDEARISVLRNLPTEPG